MDINNVDMSHLWIHPIHLDFLFVAYRHRNHYDQKCKKKSERGEYNMQLNNKRKNNPS